MQRPISFKIQNFKALLILVLLVSYIGNAQNMQVNILGGAQVTSGDTILISSGNSLTFQITNSATKGCPSIEVQNITSNNPNFVISPTSVKGNIKPTDSKNCGGNTYLNFTVTRNDSACSTENSIITIYSNEKKEFTFILSVERSPIISVLGGSPLADIVDGSTTTTATNGTYFGVVEQGLTETRTYIVTNTGSCPLVISSISSSLGHFIVGSTIYLPDYTPTTLSTSINPGSHIIFSVTFLAPTIAGTYTSTISITNTDSTANPLTFNVSANVFNFNIPGPGGVTADFRLWLKTTRGITKGGSNKVSLWKDLGSNGKDASQPISANQPTYIDAAASNINFNPVVKFENNGASIEQYLYNDTNGFYSQDIFIVMIPDETITSATPRRTIFSGVSKKDSINVTFPNDITGIGFGNYSTTNFTNETLSYSQGTEASYNGEAEINTTYSNGGIINVRNDADPVTRQQLLYNSSLLTTTSVNDIPYENVGYVSYSLMHGTPYWIGRNYDTQGSLKGRVAEIFTFASRVPDAGRQKIESYLAIKYGITLGATVAEKDYINSAGTKIWDITANAEYNYNIAGIGRDSISDLNQKQSKSLYTTNEVTIGLGGLYTTNSANINEFKKDGDFLVWGCNNGAFSGTNTNTVTIATGVTTALTRIDRTWKIVESKEDVNGDVGNIYIGIPEAAFSSFLKNANEEYVLIVSDFPSDDPGFNDTNIIDVIPLKIDTDSSGAPILDKDGSRVYKTWYNFDGTKFFTFGKAPKLIEKSDVNIGLTDFLVGEYSLNLNPFAFTVSAWVKRNNTASTRTIMAKGNKLQLRLNNEHKIEVMVDSDVARFTSNMVLSENKWHHIAFVYQSGTIFLYVDGVLDQSTQGVNPPTPNFNRFSIGAVYIDAHTIESPFLGSIDEVYVWNLALTGNQVNYLMNQEIVQNGTLVRGKVIPKDISTMPWAYLAAYYDFNSFYGTTVEGQTNDRFFLRINYRAKDKTIVESQTAPLPYITQAVGDWDTPGTWLNNSVQNIPNSASLKAGTDVEGNIVQISHNITSGNRDITVLGLLIDSTKKLTIADPTATTPIENNDGQGLRVSHYLKLDGAIDLVGESQLVQYEGSELDETSLGYIHRDQQGTANSFNYNYWSSSVGPIGGSNNANYTIKGVMKNPGNIVEPNDISFGSAYTFADKASPSEMKISSYWLYVFNGQNSTYSQWSSINESTSLMAGEGYTMKGTSGLVPISTKQNYKFRGKPYNGDISLIIEPGKDRLIGNPYPSAIDADEFILDNISEGDGRNDVNVFNGVLYFWHHFGDESSHNLKEYVGGYATYTLMGGVQAYSTDALINNSTPSIGGGKIPERNIAVNQGFFVSTSIDVELTGDISVPGGSIIFKNSQRVFERENTTSTNDGSVFFKSNSVSKTKATKAKTDARPKIRLQFNSPKGYHRQLLVGVDKNATNNFDLGYDAPIADINKEDMFWTFNKGKFVIQAVNHFNSEQELPIGIKIAKAGLATIKIDGLENIDENLSLHIKDKLTNETHNISQKAFKINLGAGEYLDRFSLIFKMQKLINEDILMAIVENEQLINSGFHLFMNNTIGELQIKNNSDDEITSVVLYNYLGQTINVWKTGLNRGTVSLPVNTTSGVYLVQISTKNGKTVTKISVE
ncbi:MAG TPA: LamG-like jellyroll fold domain-containing protein [Lutibacter sp.]